MNPPEPLPEFGQNRGASQPSSSEEADSKPSQASESPVERSPEQLLGLSIEAGKEAVGGISNVLPESDIIFPERNRDSVI